MASKSATVAVDFTRIYSSLGLGKDTVAALQAFRKRHSDAQRISGQLNAQPTTVDLAHYRSVLRNKGIVDEAEKLLRELKPVTYDVSTHVKAIETFETKAIAKAKETEAQIDVELKDLQATLSNIQDARPFEDLTVEEVGQAHPRILEAVENMVKKGKWTVPGYKERFGDLSLM
ncbi:mitochondrial ATP synthase [Russula emetica]|nr:mitochondrial ATP synthase [Russula emetica]